MATWVLDLLVRVPLFVRVPGKLFHIGKGRANVLVYRHTTFSTRSQIIVLDLYPGRDQHVVRFLLMLSLSVQHMVLQYRYYHRTVNKRS